MSAIGSCNQSSPASTATVLLVGACGLDRLLMVASYPSSDAKIRSTSYHEIGGGNAANTAVAMGRLSTLMGSRQVRVKLATKIGGDAVGKKIIQDLQQGGVVLSSPLFAVSSDKDSSTGFTTIIVSAKERSRTCIHTPGSCGELLPTDLEALDMNLLFRDVVHFHSDGRHTEVALALAREARKRGIPVSVDVEKDRGSKALDLLMEEANTIFTNADQIDDYLTRLTGELETLQNRTKLPCPNIINCSQDIQESLVATCARAIHPSSYFTRWFRQVGKEVVITKGELGSLHVKCDSLNLSDPVAFGSEGGFELNQICVKRTDASGSSVEVSHEFFDRIGRGCETIKFKSNYTIRLVGPMRDCKVHDTTGAGDAFVGGFLIGRLQGFSSEECLKLGAWVSGRKVEGPGARTSLPDSDVMGKFLGSNSADIVKSLDQLVGEYAQCTS